MTACLSWLQEYLALLISVAKAGGTDMERGGHREA